VLGQKWSDNHIIDFDDNKVLKDQLVLLMFYSSAQDYKIKFSQTLLILVNSEEAAPEGPNLNLKTF
jgi:hypothetical protein